MPNDVDPGMGALVKCWLGLHRWTLSTYIGVRDGRMVEVEVARCAVCGLKGWETVRIL